MSRTKDNKKLERITITGVCNAVGIEQGDIVMVRPSQDFTDGELVAWETSSGEIRARYLFRSKSGATYTHYSYASESRSYGTGREKYLRNHIRRIIGIVELDDSKARTPKQQKGIPPRPNGSERTFSNFAKTGKGILYTPSLDVSAKE